MGTKENSTSRNRTGEARPKKRLTPAQKRERERRRRKKRMKRMIKRIALCVLMVAALIAIIVLGVKALMGSFSDKDSQEAGAFNPKSYTIVVDAGHGGPDQGTSHEDLLEKDINLEIAKKVQKLLKKKKYKVVMIRTDDDGMVKEDRAALANKENADLFLSIHCNYLKPERGEASGIETYYNADKESSRPLAEKLQGALVAKTGAEDRGVRTDTFVVITETEMPAALVELGYLSDAGDREKLTTDKYQDELAEALVNGIQDYVESINQPEEEQSETDDSISDYGAGATMSDGEEPVPGEDYDEG